MIRREIILALARADSCGRELSRRELRGVELAANADWTRSRKGYWCIPSADGHTTYWADANRCDCPDDCAYGCKHSHAVRYLEMYASELARRLGRDDRWRGDMAELQTSESRYFGWLEAAEQYQPPRPGLLHSFGLEALGDDSFARVRHGLPPAKLRDMRASRPWVAQILGLCPTYEFRREFVAAKRDYRLANKSGSRGVWWYYHVPAGLYEVQELLSFEKSRRYFLAVDESATGCSAREIEKTEVVACLVGANVPN